MQVIRKQNLANSFFNGLPFKVQKLQGSTYWYQTCFSHSFIHYPIESQLTLGNERRGCFEEVSETREPSTGITCLDIVPIESPHNLTDPSQMETLCQRFHPDSQNQQRYVTGTRIQTRGKGKKKSHKLNTCQFHNLDNCSQGAEVKTMSQGDFLFIFIHCIKQSVIMYGTMVILVVRSTLLILNYAHLLSSFWCWKIMLCNL